MSRLHVTKNGHKSHFHLNDGKSDGLDRFVNIDTGQMYYFMGKQISGKPINPNGTLGRELRKIAETLAPNLPPKEHLPRRKNRAAEIIIAAVLLAVCLKVC